MKKIIMLLVVVLISGVAFTHSPAADKSNKLYDVIFSISIGGNGKIKAFKVNQVFDRESETKTPINMEVSTEFIQNVRQYIIRKENESILDTGVPKEFQRNFLYDPARPSKINLAPKAD